MACKPTDDEALPDELDDLMEFDLLMDWLCSFHMLVPMLDSKRVTAFVHRLQASKMTLNLNVICSSVNKDNGTFVLDVEKMKTRGFVTCNCTAFLHTNWCIHVCVDAMIKKLITRLPPTFRDERIGKWKAGRHAQAMPGGARGFT
jgi:hypothetical protein